MIELYSSKNSTKGGENQDFWYFSVITLKHFMHSHLEKLSSSGHDSPSFPYSPSEPWIYHVFLSFLNIAEFHIGFLLNVTETKKSNFNINSDSVWVCIHKSVIFLESQPKQKGVWRQGGVSLALGLSFQGCTKSGSQWYFPLQMPLSCALRTSVTRNSEFLFISENLIVSEKAVSWAWQPCLTIPAEYRSFVSHC